MSYNTYYHREIIGSWYRRRKRRYIYRQQLTPKHIIVPPTDYDVNKVVKGWNYPLLIPGYKYCGPGNPIPNGQPINSLDEACMRHDYRYRGSDDYFIYNKADEQLLAETRDETSPEAYLVKGYFNFKKAIFPHHSEVKNDPIENSSTIIP